MKKNGILHRISTAVLAGAMLLSLASCGASSSQTASSAAGKVTGTGSAKGIEGDVVVEVTADADTIYSIVVTEQNETQGIGSVACEQLPDAMVAANSYNVDGIAGATVTSDALKEAVKAALENAGLDASAFAVAKAADTTVEKTAETLDCDVVVVGAGGAGLTAAAQAAENGAKVIVVEKMPIVGGNSLKATGGMNAADTQYQADLGITDSGVQEFIEDTINGGHGINNRSLVTVMAEQSSDAIDWLTSIGAPLPKVAATGGTTHKYLHEPEDGSAVGSYLVEKLNAQAEKLGVQILLNTKATEILTNDGAACGIKAESTEHDYTINAKSVIIAAGGFGANFELMASCTTRADIIGSIAMVATIFC
jgi:fumarate reductase flavoprotein subunit